MNNHTLHTQTSTEIQFALCGFCFAHRHPNLVIQPVPGPPDAPVQQQKRRDEQYQVAQFIVRPGQGEAAVASAGLARQLGQKSEKFGRKHGRE